MGYGITTLFAFCPQKLFLECSSYLICFFHKHFWRFHLQVLSLPREDSRAAFFSWPHAFFSSWKGQMQQHPPSRGLDFLGMHRLMSHLAGLEGKPTVYQMEGLIQLCDICISVWLHRQSFLLLLLPLPVGSPGWTEQYMLSSVVASVLILSYLLPSSLLSFVSKRRATFMLPFLFPPLCLAQQPNQTVPVLGAGSGGHGYQDCSAGEGTQRGKVSCCIKGGCSMGWSCYPHGGYMNMCMCAGCRFPRGQEEEY